ncbi:MAG: hypothetical protein FJ387_21190 [Verrucomicrobia bacterium]|nr:hypothetical protein [Verrucomicrobiota bacterium]
MTTKTTKVPGRPSAGRSFPSTHWSEIQAAANRETVQGSEALAGLLTRYRPALQAYAAQAFAVSDADGLDLFQGFVERVVLERNLIARARHMPGYQFRGYLRKAWRNFIQQAHRDSHCASRYPAGGFAALDESGAIESAVGHESKPEYFDVPWARTVLEQATARMRTECEQEGRGSIWEVFQSRVRLPILEGSDPVPYAELVKRCQIESPIQARNLLVSGKRMFARHLRDVVREYVKSDADIENELSELQVILGA